MRMFGKVALTAALMVPMVAAPAAAQNYRWDIGINGGGSWYSPFLDSEETGFPDDSERDEIMFKAGWLAGAQLGMWLRPNLGLRLNGTYSERPIVYENQEITATTQTGAELLNDVNLWSGSVDLMWRFRSPNDEWLGRETLPYLALGLGGKWVNHGGDQVNCIDNEEGKAWECQPFIVSNQADSRWYALGEQKVIMGLVGLGADFRLSPNFAVRLEVNDRIYKPQVYRGAEPTAGNTETGRQVILPEGDRLVSDVVHEVGLQLGLHMLMGLARPPVVAVAPAPAPTPPPPPAPAPPAPREEAVTVCVVDPTAPGGLRMQTATYRVEQRDTVVMVNNQRVPLRQSVGNVMVARNADWYVRGQPLTINVGRDRIEYLTYQGARVIESNRLSYLGTVNGYPVYADRDEVADVIGELDDVRRTRQSGDLGAILGERRDLRDQLDDLQFVYVPLEPTGCVFQPLQLMEQVRKGK